MRNIKGFAVASDGGMKRIAITCDEIDDNGKIINSNMKVNRIINDRSVNEMISGIESYAQQIIDSE